MSRPIAALVALFAFVFWADPARAQSWTGNRSTPTLNEIVAIDATGETGWPYGTEDIEGDGATFQPPEQSLDLRTAYAVADAQRFWCRVYVSNDNAVSGSVTVYLFIDTDQVTTTGGTAVAPEIDPAFTMDPSPGGYEHVIGIGGNGMIAGVWEWTQAQGQYTPFNFTPAQYVGESGSDVDPIQIGASANHGYVQVNAELTVVGLTAACDANIFVRSINESASTTASDLNAGEAATCVPLDANNDGVPDLITTGCTSSAECPANGICVNGNCVLAPPCLTDADCAANEQCTMDGVCVARPMGNCTTNADCGDLVCDNGQCVPCTQAAMCGTGRTCAPDGRCIQGTAMNGTGGTGAGGTAGGGAGFGGLVDEPGEEVQGGACTCALGQHHRRETGAIAALVAAVAFAARRRRK